MEMRLLYQQLTAAAAQVASGTDDRHTAVGCALWCPRSKSVVAASANTLCRGVAALPERLERPTKYTYVEHAERNVIYQCARSGRVTDGCVMSVTAFPCAECARAIVQAGVACLVAPAPCLPSLVTRWGFADAVEILREGGVHVAHGAEQLGRWKPLGGDMVRVVIESPYAGDVEANLTYARACMLDCLRRNETPYASHALYTQAGVLDDTVPEERTLGIRAGFGWRGAADKTVVYIDRGQSQGMRAGVLDAEAAGRPVEYRRLGRT